ncbi:MAG TPA: hypothetical protein VM008_21315 [Phycisphaerae bacterium]|nr:hypothetical protein [Phycisphaerae bacterium]
MDFAILMAKGIAAAVGLGLVLIVTGSLLLRKKTPALRAGLGAPGAMLGFVAGSLVFWGWPGIWPAEAWQMPVIDAIAAAVLVTPAAMMRRIWRWPLLVVGLCIITALTVREKLTPRELFIPAMAGAMALYLLALQPAVRVARLWLTAIGPLFLSTFGAVLVVMLYVDQNSGRMLILLCAMSGMLIGSGAIPPLRDAGRGGIEATALLYAAVLALAAFYNYALPNPVFILLAIAPLGSVAGWIPGLNKRPWISAVVAMIITLAIVAPAIWIAVKNAPSFE